MFSSTLPPNHNVVIWTHGFVLLSNEGAPVFLLSMAQKFLFIFLTSSVCFLFLLKHKLFCKLFALSLRFLLHSGRSFLFIAIFFSYSLYYLAGAIYPLFFFHYFQVTIGPDHLFLRGTDLVHEPAQTEALLCSSINSFSFLSLRSFTFSLSLLLEACSLFNNVLYPQYYLSS